MREARSELRGAFLFTTETQRHRGGRRKLFFSKSSPFPSVPLCLCGESPVGAALPRCARSSFFVLRSAFCVPMIHSVIRTVLLFGGRSAEHEVSILSARSVAGAASKERIELIPICVARDGRFVDPEKSAHILAGEEKSDIGHPGF